jgi:hypothetical protein
MEYRCTSSKCQHWDVQPGACPVCGQPMVRATAATQVRQAATAQLGGDVDEGRAAPAAGDENATVVPSRSRSAMAPPPAHLSRTSRARSKAWVLYAVLAALVLVGSLSHPGSQTLAGLLVAGLLGLYARYLYRGGQIVVIPIPGCLLQLVTWLVVAIAVVASF